MMTITELIAELSGIRDRHGDLRIEASPIWDGVSLEVEGNRLVIYGVEDDDEEYPW